MILGFMQYFDKKKTQPTHFREKIWASLSYITEAMVICDNTKTFALNGELRYQPKLHTIRRDLSNRWKAGRAIQMVYRGPKYSILDQFNTYEEIQKCVSTQSFSLRYHEDMEPIIRVDGRKLSLSEAKQLALNDGFETLSALCSFFEWEDFDGKIIHWTDLHY